MPDPEHLEDSRRSFLIMSVGSLAFGAFFATLAVALRGWLVYSETVRPGLQVSLLFGLFSVERVTRTTGPNSQVDSVVESLVNYGNSHLLTVSSVTFAFSALAVILSLYSMLATVRLLRDTITNRKKYAIASNIMSLAAVLVFVGLVIYGVGRPTDGDEMSKSKLNWAVWMMGTAGAFMALSSILVMHARSKMCAVLEIVEYEMRARESFHHLQASPGSTSSGSANSRIVFYEAQVQV
jgi:hypothetical protein